MVVVDGVAGAVVFSFGFVLGAIVVVGSVVLGVVVAVVWLIVF